VLDEPVFESKNVGERIATKVKVVNGGAYDDKRGVIVEVRHDTFVFVRLTIGGREVVVPFGPNELERI
jgi:hypothetical protein